MIKKICPPTLYPLDRDMNKVWFVKYYDKYGNPQKKYGKFRSYTTVQERLTEGERIINELTDPAYRKNTIRKDISSDLGFLLDEWEPLLAKKSYQTYYSILTVFNRWYFPLYKKDSDINPGLFIRHLAETGHSNNHMRKVVVVLRKMFTELNKRQLWYGNPFEAIKVKKVRGKSKLPFHDNQIKELLPVIEKRDPQLRDVIDFLYYLYFRPGEVRKLKIEHILFHEKKLIAADDVIKDDDNYLKAIPVQMEAHILKYRNYPTDYYIFSSKGLPGPKMLSTNNFCARMTKILRELNYLPRYTLYSWVHTGIKKAALSGIPIKQLQIQKGHSDLKMFDEYLKSLGVEDCTGIVNNFPTLE